MSALRKSALIASLLALAVCAGCGDGPNRTAMSGKVTVAGKPLEAGLIGFRPTSGTSGPAAVTPFVDGHYTFSSENGPVVGKYRITITVTESEGKRSPIPSAVAPAPTGKLPTGSQWIIPVLEIKPGSMEHDFSLDPADMNKNPESS